MQRRKFLSLTATAAATMAVAPSLQAIDHRKEQPDAWTAKTYKDALKALYGKTDVIEDKVKVKAPSPANSGGSIPVEVVADGDFKTLALFQDVNPESTVMVLDLNETTVPKMSVKIKMKKSGTIYAIAEGKDGKLYQGKITIEVALGGCEG